MRAVHSISSLPVVSVAAADHEFAVGSFRPTVSNTNIMDTNTSKEAILERFKQAYQNKEHFVLDAWLEEVGETWIKYQLDANISDLDAEEMMAQMRKIPAEFEGIPTILTWWPRQT